MPTERDLVCVVEKEGHLGHLGAGRVPLEGFPTDEQNYVVGCWIEGELVC
jgi:hypothetical protein